MLLRSIAIVLLSLWASGCLIVGRYEEGASVPPERVAQIVPGKTTKAEILNWFGAPQALADASMVESLLVDRELEPGPVADLPFADVLVFRLTKGMLSGRFWLVYLQLDLDMRSDTLVVFFDPEDRVTYYGFSRRADELD